MSRTRARQEVTIKTFTTKVQVYWSDCDPAGIVYFGNFFRFFEIAEEDFFRSLGFPRVKIYHQLQIGFPRVEGWCRYLKPVWEGELIEVAMRIAERTQKSMLFRFEMRRDGDSELAAEGGYAVVCVNQQFQSIPLTQEILDLLADYLPPMTSRSSNSP